MSPHVPSLKSSALDLQAFGKGAFTLLRQMDSISQLFFLKEGSWAVKAKAELSTLAAELIVSSQCASTPVQAFPINEVIPSALVFSAFALKALQSFLFWFFTLVACQKKR